MNYRLSLERIDYERNRCKRNHISPILSQDDYDDVDEYIDKLESRGEASDLEVDCGSNYIIISLLLLLLSLLAFL